MSDLGESLDIWSEELTINLRHFRRAGVPPRLVLNVFEAITAAHAAYCEAMDRQFEDALRHATISDNNVHERDELRSFRRLPSRYNSNEAGV